MYGTVAAAFIDQGLVLFGGHLAAWLCCGGHSEIAAATHSTWRAGRATTADLRTIAGAGQAAPGREWRLCRRHSGVC